VLKVAWTCVKSPALGSGEPRVVAEMGRNGVRTGFPPAPVPTLCTAIT
jgi:hypothetical protein